MRSVGIIAEYNPFHMGHMYQLQQAKEKAKADVAVVVMSQCFTQRGEPALVLPSVRARMALESGADVVFGMPTVFSCRDGENFASGGVRILEMLNVDAISFGVENDDISLLEKYAEILENESEKVKKTFRSASVGGVPYPAALAKAVGDEYGVLSKPNNTLAVCYLRSLLSTGSKMQICPVKRDGDYNSSSLNQKMPSAGSLRNAVFSGNYGALRGKMPDECIDMLMNEICEGRVVFPGALDAPLTYRLRTMSREEYAALPNVSEGIENRLYAAAMGFSSREEIIQRTKTRRYTYGRISRMCAHALLHLTAADFANAFVETPRLLGLRKSAVPFLQKLKEKGIIVENPAKMAGKSLSVRQDMMAYDIWTCGCGEKAGLGYMEKVVVL